VWGVRVDMSNNNDTELPQASPPLATIEDKLRQLDRAIVSTDDNYPTQYRIPLEDLVKFITTETTKAEHRARMNLLEYFDQIPKNEYMDWKGLIADCKRLLKEEVDLQKEQKQ
jgi:hypothetical protein